MKPLVRRCVVGKPTRGFLHDKSKRESLVVEFKKEVAKMREREATDLEIQSMLEFVEQFDSSALRR